MYPSPEGVALVAFVLFTIGTFLLGVLWFTRGLAPFQCPEFRGLTYEEAMELVDRNRLCVSIWGNPSEPPLGKVVFLTPSPGSSVRERTLITLFFEE